MAFPGTCRRAALCPATYFRRAEAFTTLLTFFLGDISEEAGDASGWATGVATTVHSSCRFSKQLFQTHRRVAYRATCALTLPTKHEQHSASWDGE